MLLITLIKVNNWFNLFLNFIYLFLHQIFIMAKKILNLQQFTVNINIRYEYLVESPIIICIK